MRRHAAILILLVVQFAANAYTAFRLGPVYDEPGHLVAGLSHWQYGTMVLYKVNPPLPRMVMTLPAFLMGARIDYRPALTPALDRPEIHYGFTYLAERPRERLRLLAICRLTTWLWLAIGSVVLYAGGATRCSAARPECSQPACGPRRRW
ncbi:MAG: hypothetical protein KatS3mg111_2360 [Pirellulaceae bacterium]|nr:MAG: hypothetical protein KatS3mg111_2360 [Pirellulaceae bacterium]